MEEPSVALVSRRVTDNPFALKCLRNRLGQGIELVGLKHSFSTLRELMDPQGCDDPIERSAALSQFLDGPHNADVVAQINFLCILAEESRNPGYCMLIQDLLHPRFEAIGKRDCVYLSWHADGPYWREFRKVA